MTKKHILAIDAGTTGITCLVLDERLRVAGRAYQEIAQHYPKPGWVEHDAAEIWTTTRAVAKRALKDARLEAGRLAAVGITNQRETTVLWDRQTGEPLHNALVWQDRRTAPRCAELRNAGRQEDVRQRTGLVLDPYFSSTKLEWLLQNVPGAAERAQAGELAFGTIDTWLTWKLTGGAHVTDPSNASRTMLWNIRTGEWDNDLLETFGIPESVLPEVQPSAHIYGEADLGASVPVAGMAGDQQAALFGQRCTKPGEAKNTYGTGCFLLQHTGTDAVESRHGLLTTRAASVDDTSQFALEGAVFVGGATIQWLRDGLHMIERAPEIDALASETEDSHGVIFVPAFTGLGAPHWDPDARGAILGLTRGVDRRHLARAALEGIAYQSHEVLEAMEKDSGARLPSLRVDGGATNSKPLLQFQADLLQRPVIRPSNIETTAMGAAMLAGIGAGLWSLADLRSGDREDATVVEPNMAASEVDARLATWRKAVAAVRAFKP